jgi:protein-tyrosine phosphatase
VKLARTRGYDLSRLRASHLSPKDFSSHDYILAMDRGHLRILEDMAPPDATARVGLFSDASARWKGEDVPDPYYGNAEGFEHVLDIVEETAERWVDRLEGELDPSDFRLQGSR